MFYLLWREQNLSTFSDFSFSWLAPIEVAVVLKIRITSVFQRLPEGTEGGFQQG
jgi:hypothetical protein